MSEPVTVKIGAKCPHCQADIVLTSELEISVQHKRGVIQKASVLEPKTVEASV